MAAHDMYTSNPHEFVPVSEGASLCKLCGLNEYDATNLKHLTHIMYAADQKTHKFVAASDNDKQCRVCDRAVIHRNHRGYDYDIPPEHRHREYQYTKNRGVYHQYLEDTGNICRACRMPKEYGYHMLHQYTASDGNAEVCSVCNDTYSALQHSYIFALEETVPPVKSLIDTELDNMKPETIAEEAQRIVYGDREQAYDDPNRNFRKVAYMVNGVLDEKLKVSGSVTPNDVAFILQCLKISRESFKPNRENRVDGIGYWICLDRIVEAGDNNAPE